MKYLSSDEQGNKYEITSETGEIDLQNPDIIFMNNVKAQINLANHPTIYISSNYAKYNTKNYETYFRSNVLLEYMKHSATSGNLNLSFENNLISMYEKIIYKNPEAQLAADRLEIDLLTKNSKIFMDDKSKKIKMIAKK